MKKIILTTVYLIGFSSLLIAQHLSDRLTFSAQLRAKTGTMSSGNGVAAFMLNSKRDSLFLSISAAKLSSPISAYHIRNSRTNGNIIIDFDRKILGNSVRSFITGSSLKNLLPDLINGNLFLSVHTQKYPTAEITGNIQLETDWGFTAKLDGYQLGSSTTALGFATINIGMNADTMVVKVVTSPLSPITNVALYFAKQNELGAVALDLTELVSADANMVSGGWKLSTGEWAELATALLSNQLAIQINTQQYPEGELRGQIIQHTSLQFDMWINNPIYDTAYGLGYAALNNTFDTLQYHAFYNGANTVADIFVENEKGERVKQLSPSTYTISGLWTKYDDINPLTDGIIATLLKGKLSLNLYAHDKEKIATGFYTKLAREGFIAELTNMLFQTESGAQGTAVASYDRDRKNIHCMFAFDGLQGDLLTSHIFFGKKGEAGSVEMVTEPFSNNGSYKFLRTDELFAKTKNLRIAKKENTYLFIQTTSYNDGEIGGLFNWNYKTTTLTEDTVNYSGLNETLISSGSFKVYPNPTTQTIKVDLNAKVDGFATLIVSNMSGDELIKQTTQIIKGKNTVDMDMNELAAGIYFIELAINGQSTSNTKVSKQ